MDYYNLNAIVPPIMAPIINTMELAAFIQSTTDKYFSIIDLANMFCLVPVLNASQPVFLPLQREMIHLYLAIHRVSTAILFHTIFAGKTLTEFNFLQEHKYDIYIDAILFQGDSLKTLIQDIQIFKKELAKRVWVIDPHLTAKCHHFR